MTKTAVGLRVSGQVATALPERPVIGLVVRTDRARDLEQAVHGVLRVRGQHRGDVPGSEWFDSNPSEVETIVALIQDTDGSGVRS
jgi:hypothetical protein